tara:strand:+ start:239 stop:460 length:222 start_codon:yes stop_codon:yes gene_type:complete
MVQININDYVKLDLTEHGLKQITRRGYKPEYDSAGMLKIQLWDLMNSLGDALFNGSEQSILNNTIILTKHEDV